MITTNGMTILVQWTTPTQVNLVVDELVQRYIEVGELWKEAHRQAVYDGQLIDPDLDALYNALENMLCDLDVPGFEREEFPRY